MSEATILNRIVRWQAMAYARDFRCYDVDAMLWSALGGWKWLLRWVLQHGYSCKLGDLFGLILKNFENMSTIYNDDSKRQLSRRLASQSRLTLV